MRRKFLPLIECPYCARGEVLIDPHAVREYMAASDEHLCVHERPEQRVFRFHPEHDIDQPCRHLFLMSGNLAWRKSESRGVMAEGVDFDWHHPRLKEIRGNEKTAYAFWDGVILAPENVVRPDTKYVHDFFERRWIQRGRGERVGHLNVSGQFLFVESVDAFLATLPAFASTYEQALQKWTPESEPSDMG